MVDRPALVGVAGIGSLPVLSGTMLAVALPEMTSGLHASPAAAAAVVSVYLAVVAVTQPFAGGFADRVGASGAIRVGLGILAFGSVMAAASWSLAALLAARVVQAVGAAVVLPGVHRRVAAGGGGLGRQFGVLTAVGNLAAAIGPLAGGVVVAQVGWRGVFAATVVVAGAAFLAVPRREEPGTRASSPAGAGGLGPMVRDPRMAAAACLNGLDNVVLHLLLIGLPFALADRGDLAAAKALTTMALAAAVAAPAGGRLADRCGHGVAVRAGFLTAVVGLVAMHGTGAAGVGVVVAGVGLGLQFPSLQAGPLGLAPVARHGTVAGLMASSRQVGAGIGAAAAAGLCSIDATMVPVAAFVAALAAVPLTGSLGSMVRQAGPA